MHGVQDVTDCGGSPYIGHGVSATASNHTPTRCLQVTWGHPCCFERVKRKAGALDENRAFFRTTVDVCREDWLILHKIEYIEEMRYLGRRLRQCGTVRAVLDRARALAVATAEPLPAFPEDGKVRLLFGQTRVIHCTCPADNQLQLGEAADSY